MTLRRTAAFAFLLLIVLLGSPQSAASQEDPLQGQIQLHVEERAREGFRPRLAMSFVTVGDYPCSNYTIDARRRRKADTIAITIVGLALNGGLCAKEVGPAHGNVPLALGPGSYRVAISRGPATDWMDLRVTKTQLILRPVGAPTFTQPDTTVFTRPAARSFLVSCEKRNAPELCADFGDWLARRRGIIRQPLAAGDRIGFPPYRGDWNNGYQLFEYADDRTLEPVKRCMLHLADTIEQAVGVSVIIQTADGQVFRAWSRRSFHEPHIPVPRKISGSGWCPN